VGEGMKGIYYLEAAERISDLADEYANIDNNLANVLRAGASRILELSGSFMIKTASVEDKKLNITEDC